MCSVTAYIPNLRYSLTSKLLLESEVPQLHVARSLTSRRPITERNIAIDGKRRGNRFWVGAGDGGQRGPICAGWNRRIGKQVRTGLSVSGASVACRTRIGDPISAVYHESAFGIPCEADAWAKLVPPRIEGCLRRINSELLPFRRIWIEERETIMGLME